MKKLFFAFCMIIACSSQVAMAQSKTKPQATETKASMLKTLRGILVKSMIKNGVPKAKYEKFVNCFTNDLGEKLSPEDLTLFYKLNTLKSGPAKTKFEKEAEKVGIKEKVDEIQTNCFKNSQ